ncbi:MAG TPA: circularly permuted type 2 ATP-grasp protein [Polyangiaceae bacterium]|jgi:uncharacterized circularly permuted ATP-grasp superfamily protein/uncharacterized alpha-E superfamily protein|nr:circularly permuted type 2 ATP-grasp protein [Polyangiaceae bacterium]
MPTETLLQSYEPSKSRYNEMLDDARSPRPHWRAFLSRLAGFSPETTAQRSEFVQDAIVSDGVTYNVYADPQGTSRPWELDLLPFILPPGEWEGIAAAVAQRARLLNAVLRDLYGPQKLFAEGLLPPALVFGQRSFLWPMQNIAPPDGVLLHLYAADLARSPNGKWWVLSDRTRSPSGAGYALQNRMTLSRAFPDAFRDLHVEQLAPFFKALQDSLYRLAPTSSEPPLVALLTPGPYNETYFEHSFLARYLGFPLVEGQDLIVRGDRVYLKTLRGLRRVHAILRRLDDDFCDPVELRADSALGVPGLLHAIRAGNVVVANAPGTALLETGAFGGFYPAVSERLFGEKLAMPSIATWWCGEEPALDYVLGHLDDLVIKPAYPSMRFEPTFGHALDSADRAAMVERLRAQPHAYVAQERVHLSQSPRWNGDGRLVPRATTLRVFAVATPSGYMVMPGGLTRVAPQDGDVVSMQWGGTSKDTWILADKPVTSIPLRRPRLGVQDIAKSAVDIASRVGENLYWMGRYAERCEGLARLLRAGLVRIADDSPDEHAAIASLTEIAVRLKVFKVYEASGKSTKAKAPPPPNLVDAVVDASIPGGLAANVARLHSCANQVRERMSTDNWHVLNRLLKRMPGPDAQLGAALESLDEVMLACVSLAGFALDDMTRDDSWQFMLLGRRLERLAHFAGVIAHVLEFDEGRRVESLEWLLEVANSIVTFRARYRRSPELLPVLHLVVLDESNPHAVLFQLCELAEMHVRLHTELGGATAPEANDAVVTLIEAFRTFSLEGFELESGEALEAACAELSRLLLRAEQAALGLSDELQRRFFSHAGAATPSVSP